MSLHGKVAIVTGASGGLGSEIAKQLASEGCDLCLVGRNAKELKKVQKECQTLLSSGTRMPVIVTGDLTDDDIRKLVVDTTIKSFQKIGILINNAGIMKVGSLEQSTLEDFDETFDINFRVPYSLCRLCVPHLTKEKGCIINMSSVVSVRPNYTVTPYAISKAALDQLTICLAAELGPKGVRVISINPGVIGTDLWKIEGMSDEQRKNFMESLISGHALKRIGKPEEVARVVAMLASDSASFVTGNRILIDGGMTVMPPC